jgi:hypothetical protein
MSNEDRCEDLMDKEVLRYLWTPDLDPLFWRPGRGGVVSRWYGHVPFAHWIVRAVKPRTLVELGTHNGVSYSAFCEAAARIGLDIRCYAVDTWKGDEQSGYYSEEVYLHFRRFHDERYSAFSELLRCSFDDAAPYLPDASVDLLHIDGFHTYESVRHDFENWRPKLSDRAVVLFHDTNVRERDFGVWRLWEELRRQFLSFEFLHGHGLGVLAVGESTSPEVTALCSLTDPAIVGAIRERFALLGDLLAQREFLQYEEVPAREAHALVLERELSARDERVQSLGKEVAAREERMQSMEKELAARDERLQLLGKEVAAREERISLFEIEAGRRIAAEEQLRARAAQRAREARAEMAKLAAAAEPSTSRPRPSTEVDTAGDGASPGRL